MLTVGEAMALFIAQQPGPLDQVSSFTRVTAGAELNVAVGLARLGFSVAYLSRLGDDSYGRHLRRFMAAEGIATHLVATDAAHPTGTMLKTLALDGRDPDIEYFRSGSAASHLGLVDQPVEVLRRTRHVHLTGITPALSSGARALVFEMARAARSANCSISFDPNLRPRLWASPAEMRDVLNELASHCDWVLPGLAEGRLLTGADTPEGIADFYLRRGASKVVVKLGPVGAFYASPEERGAAAGWPVERVVDTVGAGDAFAVGVISALLEGQTLAAAASRGNQLGARAVGFPGDCDGLPTRAQLQSS